MCWDLEYVARNYTKTEVRESGMIYFPLCIQPSKTECVFFPPPQYFDKMEATATLENGTETQAEMTIASKRSKESEEARGKDVKGRCVLRQN